MNKAWLSIILGFLAFVTTFLAPLSLVLSITGLILGVISLRSPSKNISLPYGVGGSYGGKKGKVQPFVSSKFVSIVGIAFSLFSLLSVLVYLGFIYAVISTTGYSSN